MARPDSLSLAQARRTTIAAQGLASARPKGRIDRRHLRRVFDRLGLVQVDSVNVLVRSHYLPLFSRLGPYDRSLLDRIAYTDHEVFEYWGHDASLIRADLEPLFRWRMQGDHQWSGMRHLDADHGALIESLYAEVMASGPASAGDLDASDRKKGPWWGWGDTKRALEHLFHEGRVGAVRRSNFERAYCDPELVVPAAVRRQPTPTSRDAMIELLVFAARAHGVGTAKDLSDYFRLPIKAVRPLLEEMADDGLVDRVHVEGWPHLAYVHPEMTVPRRVHACALVSPFDSIMWERDRVERLFGFRYRIEIYVPKPKRVFGYYVLPFLLGDRYVGRVDLKADRVGSRLLVRSAFAEAGVDHGEVAERLHGELQSMARWLDLDDVVVEDHGDLAPALRAVSG